MTEPVLVTPAEMQLGDRIQCYEDPCFSTGIIKSIDSHYVHIFRPYGTTAEFSYSGGVICYIGIEEYSLSRTSQLKYRLLSRTKLK